MAGLLGRRLGPSGLAASGLAVHAEGLEGCGLDAALLWWMEAEEGDLPSGLAGREAWRESGLAGRAG